MSRKLTFLFSILTLAFVMVSCGDSPEKRRQSISESYVNSMRNYPTYERRVIQYTQEEKELQEAIHILTNAMQAVPNGNIPAINKLSEGLSELQSELRKARNNKISSQEYLHESKFYILNFSEDSYIRTVIDTVKAEIVLEMEE